MLLGMAQGQVQAVSREVGPVLLYVPVVAPAEFDVAISYLVRRLEENASPDNFLSVRVPARRGRGPVRAGAGSVPRRARPVGRSHAADRSDVGRRIGARPCTKDCAPHPWLRCRRPTSPRPCSASRAAPTTTAAVARPSSRTAVYSAREIEQDAGGSTGLLEHRRQRPRAAGEPRLGARGAGSASARPTSVTRRVAAAWVDDAESLERIMQGVVARLRRGVLVPPQNAPRCCCGRPPRWKPDAAT